MAWRSIEERFWEKVNKTDDGCWEWTACCNQYGYGILSLGPSKKLRVAHRISYELNVGEIPSGLVIDHLCGNRKCVNPAHLEAVTQGENLKRSPHTLPSRELAQTHCKHGHPFSGENLNLLKNGYRRCRTCQRSKDREYYWRVRSVTRTKQRQVDPEDDE